MSRRHRLARQQPEAFFALDEWSWPGLQLGGAQITESLGEKRPVISSNRELPFSDVVGLHPCLAVGRDFAVVLLM